MRIRENKLNLFEQNLECFEKDDFLKCKLKLEEIWKIKAHGVKISSKYNLYEYGKNFKSSEKSFCSESNS